MPSCPSASVYSSPSFHAAAAFSLGLNTDRAIYFYAYLFLIFFLVKLFHDEPLIRPSYILEVFEPKNVTAWY